MRAGAPFASSPHARLLRLTLRTLQALRRLESAKLNRPPTLRLSGVHAQEQHLTDDAMKVSRSPRRTAHREVAHEGGIYDYRDWTVGTIKSSPLSEIADSRLSPTVAAAARSDGNLRNRSPVALHALLAL